MKRLQGPCHPTCPKEATAHVVTVQRASPRTQSPGPGRREGSARKAPPPWPPRALQLAQKHEEGKGRGKWGALGLGSPLFQGHHRQGRDPEQEENVRASVSHRTRAVAGLGPRASRTTCKTGQPHRHFSSGVHHGQRAQEWRVSGSQAALTCPRQAERSPALGYTGLHPAAVAAGSWPSSPRGRHPETLSPEAGRCLEGRGGRGLHFSRVHAPRLPPPGKLEFKRHSRARPCQRGSARLACVGVAPPSAPRARE